MSMWAGSPTPITFGGGTFICDKTLDYNGHHFEAFVCYNFSCLLFGDGMVIEGTKGYEIIPTDLFDKHFHYNRFCYHGQDLRNCYNCKHRYSLELCTLHERCSSKVEKFWREHCEDWKWVCDKD